MIVLLLTMLKYMKFHLVFVRLTSTTMTWTIWKIINKIYWCIYDVPPQESYTLITGGAVDDINTLAPLAITGISVPSYTVAPSTTFITSMHSHTHPQVGQMHLLKVHTVLTCLSHVLGFSYQLYWLQQQLYYWYSQHCMDWFPPSLPHLPVEWFP